MTIRATLLALATLTISSVALPVAAACTGPSMIDRLTAADRSLLAARVDATPYGEGLLWQGERDGARLTVAGTMHIHDARLAPIMARLDADVAASDLLLVEMTATEEAQMQQALTGDPDIMFITDGPTLPERLDEETWGMIVDAARARDVPPFLVSKFRPWYLMLTLSIPGCAMADLAAGRRGLDHMIMDRAAAAGVPMRALEPWDTLFAVFDQSSEADQIEMLRMSLLDASLQEEMFVAMLDGYFAGRVAELWELSRLSTGYLPGVDADESLRLFALTEAALLTRRNHAWIDVIETATSRNDHVVVAAGAAHLPGEEGILSLLAARGWRFAPLDGQAP